MKIPTPISGFPIRIERRFDDSRTDQPQTTTMKYSTPVTSLVTSLTLLAAPAVTTAATLKGLWGFDDGGDIGAATVGDPLSIAGTAPAWSATLPDDGANPLGGVITTTAGAGNHLISAHGIGANGGGAFVNQYSFLVDLFSPAESRGSWRTLYQTNTGNANDGDYFIRNSDDQLGVADLTYSPTPINEAAWSRLVVTFDLGVEVKTYLDGALVHTHSAGALDGRFSLDPTVIFFGDNDGDNAPLHVGALALWDGALTGAEVAGLGRAGDAIPEPSAALFALLGLGIAALSRRRRT
jgi:uncharacterized protein (TIGR03382 family)